jgi:hypothetical protein
LDLKRPKVLKQALSFFGLEASCTQVWKVKPDFYWLIVISSGPEIRGEDRFIVFISLHPPNVASYDGFSAVDEVQFPLFMAIRANTSELKQKFVEIFFVRFHICKNADPHILLRLPKPLYSKVRKLLKDSIALASELSRAIKLL